MGFTILLLALFPMAFLPDFLDSDADDENHADDDLGSATDVGPISDQEDLWATDVLSPVNQDDFADDGSQDPDAENVLSPIDEDDEATPSDGEDGDVLLPIDVDDPETDLPPEETRTLELNVDGEPVHIENFQAGADVLQVIIDPPEDNVMPETNVELSSDGQNCLVFVGNDLVAVIRDAPNVMAHDVLIDVAVR